MKYFKIRNLRQNKSIDKWTVFYCVQCLPHIFTLREINECSCRKRMQDSVKSNLFSKIVREKPRFLSSRRWAATQRGSQKDGENKMFLCLCISLPNPTLYLNMFFIFPHTLEWYTHNVKRDNGKKFEINLYYTPIKCQKYFLSFFFIYFY